MIVRQKKRPRHLYRHLLARGVPGGLAAKTAFQRRGIWHRSVSYGMHKAYPNAWFADRLMSLKEEWQRLHPPEQVSYEQGLLFEPKGLGSIGRRFQPERQREWLRSPSRERAGRGAPQ